MEIGSSSIKFILLNSSTFSSKKDFMLFISAASSMVFKGNRLGFNPKLFGNPLAESKKQTI